MVELLRNIHREQEEIKKHLNEEDEQTEFYREFFKKNSYSSLKSLEKADKLELSIALIMNENPELNVEEVKRIVHENQTLFNGVDRLTLKKFVEVLCQLQDIGYYQNIRNRFALGKPIELTDIFEKNGVMLLLINQMIRIFDITPQQFVPFMDLFEKHGAEVADALAISCLINEIKRERDYHYQEIEEMRKGISEEDGIEYQVNKRKQDRAVARIMADSWDIQGILEPIKNIRKYYEKKEQEQKAKRRSYTKQQEAYEVLEKEIYNAIRKGEEIQNIDKLIAKIPNEEIRIQALTVIYLHNKTIYDKATEEYKKLTANQSSRYQVLLEKYGISPESYEVGTVMSNSIEDLELMLARLVNLNITIPKELLKIAQSSDLETVENYASLAEKGVITTILLLSHPNLFNPTSKEYENIMRNIALIKERKLNPFAFKASEEVLITPHKTFRQGIDTLAEYDLQSQMKSGMNYTFLTYKNLQQGIDVLLELGLEETLVQDIEILNYASRFKRLQLLKTLNMPISTKEEIMEVLTSNKFFIPDSEIDNYIYNASVHNIPSRVVLLTEPKKKNPDITKLEEYESTERTYNFNGVIASKNKVKRNLSMIETSGKTTDRLIYGIIKDSILTDEEIDRVKSAIVSKNIKM